MFPQDGAAAGVAVKPRPRTSSRPSSVRSYGRGEDAVSVKSMIMAGSRPPSPNGRSGKDRRTRTQSVLSTNTVNTVSGDQIGYVDVVRSARPTVVKAGSLPGSTRAATDRARSEAGSTRAPPTDAGLKDEDDREHEIAVNSQGASSRILVLTL